jgi:hypothetical protein
VPLRRRQRGPQPVGCPDDYAPRKRVLGVRRPAGARRSGA